MLTILKSSLSRIIFFAIVEVGALLILWSVLPSSSISYAILAVVTLSLVMAVFHSSDLVILSSAAILLALINYWLANAYIGQFWALVICLASLTLVGIVGSDSADSLSGLEKFRMWLIVGFISAQIFVLLSYWPISFLQKSIVETVFFYLFWRLSVMSQNREPVVSHFVFTGLAVMVVLGTIAWNSFPALKTF